ncbi:MAG: hypothetical protein ACTHWO_00345 [Nesterenkonia sp.]
MSSESVRLRAARSIYRGRVGAPTAGDRWFSLYLIAFLTGWYVLPVAYVIGDYLDPEFARSLTDADTAPYVASGVVLLGVVALWLGRAQGPAVLSPFLAHTLLGTDISRRRILLRPTLTALLIAAAVLSLLAMITMFAVTQAGAWGWGRFGELGIAAFLGGLLLGLVAFVGQRMPLRWVVLLSAAAVPVGAAHLILPATIALSPAGWFSALWSAPAAGVGTERWSLLLLGAAALLGIMALAVVPVLLGRLPAHRVLEQSRRISDARLFTSVGSLGEAADLFRAKPRRRLSGHAVASRPGALAPLLMGLRQDAVSTLRSPLSGVAALTLIPTGAALLTLAAATVGQEFSDSALIVTVPTALLGVLLMFIGSGSLTEGWRQLKRELDAAALFGWSARAALGRRLLWPVIATAVLTALGTTSVVMFTASEASAGAWTAGLALLILSARYFQSMRPRDIPVEMLAPTLLPGGMDLSAVKIVAWLGDGVILVTTGVLAVVVLPWPPQTLAAALLVLVLVAVLWGWGRTGHRFFAAAPRHRL